MAKVFLKKKISDRISEGHPWVFRNEIGDIVGLCRNGDVVEVFSHLGSFVGRGFINLDAQIQIRILTHDNQEIDAAFIQKRMKAAWAYRQQLGITENCRLVHSEADGLPGLIIEKYNDYFVVQTLNAGIDFWKAEIVKVLMDLFNPKGIYERNDALVRTVEGLPIQKGFLSAPFDTKITILENSVPIIVDQAHGTKTGYFLDRVNLRSEIKKLVKDAKVLDAFCYTGSYGIHAAVSGAKSVYGIDFLPEAIALAKENSSINKLENICNFECKNAFDELKNLVKNGNKFDVVILDPPTFVKNRESMDKAIAGYKEINLRAMKLLEPNGILVTSTMSNFISRELLIQTIKDAAKDAKKQIKQIYSGSQSPDFPVLWNMPNSEYLKSLIVQVL